MNLSTSISVAVISFVLFGQLLAVDDEFCSTRKHYTAPGFTCCNFKRFDSPQTNPFHYPDRIKECMTKEIDDEPKLVKRTWLLYECLIKKGTQSLKIEDFRDHMIGRFASDKNIQEEIKQTIIEIQKHLPKTSRRKRGLRVKREDDQTDATTEEITTTPMDEQTMGTTGSTEDGAINTDGGSSTTVDGGGDGTSTPATMMAETTPENGESQESTLATESTTVEEGQTSTPPPVTDPPAPDLTENAGTSQPLPPIPLYRYLSVFEYHRKFKDYIPNEELLLSWDVYFVAEFQACHKLSGDKDEDIKEFGAERCYSWLQRTARDGECCGTAPIPMPLFSYPLYEREEVRNFTAKNILTMAGKYTWHNISFSSNIDRCQRLALAVLEKYTSVQELKADMNEYIASNATGPGPNYQAIARKLVPYYYHENMKQNIVTTILPQNNPQCFDRSDQEKHFYEQIECDSDLQKIQNLATSIHQFAVASEWDKPHVNKTRYLMWTCDAYRMVSQRIRYYDYVANNDCY